MEELIEYVGDAVVLSNLVIIEKTRPDGTVQGRTILDCKASGLSASSTTTEKAVLPRALDVVCDCIELMGTDPSDPVEEDDDDVAHVALCGNDVVDAYWNVPVHPSERRFFCCRLRGRC